jgi:hypothetical protein
MIRRDSSTDNKPMKPRKEKVKKLILSIVFWGLLIGSFLFFSALIILKANGYQFNVQTWKINKTGMIVLNADPQGKIYLDGKALRKPDYPAKIGGLSPGIYDLEITNPNYQSWQESIAVNYGEASVYDHILLFKSNASDTNAPADLTLDRLTAESKNYQNNLNILGSEIYYKGSLITRFSQNVSTAVVYPDGFHILFQTGQQIRIIDIDGSNNKLLFDLPSDQATQLSFRQGGNLVIYWDTLSSSAKAKIVH